MSTHGGGTEKLTLRARREINERKDFHRLLVGPFVGSLLAPLLAAKGSSRNLALLGRASLRRVELVVEGNKVAIYPVDDDAAGAIYQALCVITRESVRCRTLTVLGNTRLTLRLASSNT